MRRSSFCFESEPVPGAGGRRGQDLLSLGLGLAVGSESICCCALRARTAPARLIALETSPNQSLFASPCASLFLLIAATRQVEVKNEDLSVWPCRRNPARDPRESNSGQASGLRRGKFGSQRSSGSVPLRWPAYRRLVLCRGRCNCSASPHGEAEWLGRSSLTPPALCRGR